MLDQRTTILPERAVYGTFWQRLGAYLLDWLILLIPTSIVTSAFGNTNYFLQVMSGKPTQGSLAPAIINSLITIAYFVIMESGKSQATVGKMALRLKVTNMRGERISFANALGRYLGKFVSAIIIGIGFLMVLWDEKRQGLHDKMAGTLVLRK